MEKFIVNIKNIAGQISKVQFTTKEALLEWWEQNVKARWFAKLGDNSINAGMEEEIGRCSKAVEGYGRWVDLEGTEYIVTVA